MPFRHYPACCWIDWSTKKERRKKKKNRSCALVLVQLNPRLQVWVIFTGAARWVFFSSVCEGWNGLQRKDRFLNQPHEPVINNEFSYPVPGTASVCVCPWPLWISITGSWETGSSQELVVGVNQKAAVAFENERISFAYLWHAIMHSHG